jgi:hypothetical protein
MKEGKKYLRIKKGDSYTCLICFEEVKTKDQFKLHLFTTHGDVESQAAYNRSVAELISPSILQRLREPIFNKLAEGKFDSYIIKLLGLDEKSTKLPTRTFYSILGDFDDEQSMLRQSAYLKKRVVLQNLAERERELKARSSLPMVSSTPFSTLIAHQSTSSTCVETSTMSSLLCCCRDRYGSAWLLRTRTFASSHSTCLCNE